MIAWAGIKRYKKKLTNNLDFVAKSRWQLDNKAPYLKGPGLKLSKNIMNFEIKIYNSFEQTI